MTSLGKTSVRYTVPDQGYVILKRGNLEAVVVDNRAVDDAVLPGHRAGYHGIALLRHTRQPRNLFVPAYAGLNSVQRVMRADYVPVDGPGDAASVREQIHRFVQQRRPNQ